MTDWNVPQNIRNAPKAYIRYLAHQASSRSNNMTTISNHIFTEIRSLDRRTRTVVFDAAIEWGITSAIYAVRHTQRDTVKRRAHRCNASTPTTTAQMAAAALLDSWIVESRPLGDLTGLELDRLIAVTASEARGVLVNLYFYQSIRSNLGDDQTISEAFPDRTRLLPLINAARRRAARTV